MSSPTISAAHAPHPNNAALWSQHLHRRVMRLLLQHDQRLFHGQFRVFYTQSTLPKLPLLQLYDNYLRLLVLKDELLDDIMPRICRQLSLQSTQVSMQEDAPTRGDVDWPRTIMRTLNEIPDQPPLRFDTSQQQRSLIIPENLFVVAVLLNYRQAMQDILKKDLADEILNEQERQQFIEADERTERELSSPSIHLLHTEARNADIEQLAEQVRRRLHPGNSPYRDLLQWWEQFSTLHIGHIGRIADRRQLALIGKRTDDESDAWLYELWIVLELLHMLSEMHMIAPADIQIARDQIRFRFVWNERKFFFTYNRLSTRGNEMLPGWKNVPASNPRFMIEREAPLEIRPQGILIWREPPVICDISYSNVDGTHDSSYMAAFRKMLGEMCLRGAAHAVLFTPTLPGFTQQEDYTRVYRDGSAYTEGSSYNLADPNIRLCKLTPGTNIGTLQDRLRALLDDVTSRETLPERPEPACHGIILDEDTINASRSRPAPYNVLCPKPHIGRGIFDLVNDKVHCLKDPHICHIYHQARLAPFIIRASTRDAMNQQSSDIRIQADETLSQAEQMGDEDKAEQLRSHIFLGVGRTVEQYVKLRGNTATLESYFEEWVFGDYWKNHPRCFDEETRNILLSGEYVWNEYKQTPTLKDWAAPAVQYCRALEAEIKRRLHDYYPDPKYSYPDVQKGGFDVPCGNMTLGAVETICRLKGKDPNSAKDANEAKRIKTVQHNWSLCNALIISSGANITTFDSILKRMVNEHVSTNRNQLAHGGPISHTTAQELRETIIGRQGKPGILYLLAECLEPKR